MLACSFIMIAEYVVCVLQCIYGLHVGIEWRLRLGYEIKVVQGLSACKSHLLGMHARRVLMQGKHRAYLPWWMQCDAQGCSWFGTACLTSVSNVFVCLLYRIHVLMCNVVKVFDEM